MNDKVQFIQSGNSGKVFGQKVEEPSIYFDVFLSGSKKIARVSFKMLVDVFGTSFVKGEKVTSTTPIITCVIDIGKYTHTGNARCSIQDFSFFKPDYGAWLAFNRANLKRNGDINTKSNLSESYVKERVKEREALYKKGGPLLNHANYHNDISIKEAFRFFLDSKVFETYCNAVLDLATKPEAKQQKLL